MPRLICDEPSPGEIIDKYVITGLPIGPVEVLPDPNPEFGFSYDLSGLAPGSYTVKANACNEWGCSIDSAPFDFTVLAIPSQPICLGILFT